MYTCGCDSSTNNTSLSPLDVMAQRGAYQVQAKSVTHYVPLLLLLLLLLIFMCCKTSLRPQLLRVSSRTQHTLLCIHGAFTLRYSKHHCCLVYAGLVC